MKELNWKGRKIRRGLFEAFCKKCYKRENCPYSLNAQACLDELEIMTIPFDDGSWVEIRPCFCGSPTCTGFRYDAYGTPNSEALKFHRETL